MNKVTIFKYEENKLVRTMDISGEPWFVLKDVCDVLGLSTPARVAERLDSDEVSQAHLIDSVGRSQEMTIISESGLYNVILRSDKPEADALRHHSQRKQRSPDCFGRPLLFLWACQRFGGCEEWPLPRKKV